MINNVLDSPRPGVRTVPDEPRDARRKRQIARLLALGFPAAVLPDLTGLGLRQLRRIGGVRQSVAPARPRGVRCSRPWRRCGAIAATEGRSGPAGAARVWPPAGP